MGVRKWIEQAPIQRSLLLGVINGLLLPFLPHGYEITIGCAIFMPGVYLAFAMMHDGNTEVMYEMVVTFALLYYYVCYSLPKLTQEGDLMQAPIAVAVHGMIDWIHHLKLTPSSKHVDLCFHEYPIICGCFDFGLAATMALIIQFG